MLIERNQLSTRDGASLFFEWTLPRGPFPSRLGPCRGVVAITHGMGEHSSRYGHLVERFVARGWAVACYDLRGHGRSSGRRGDACNFAALLEDLDLVVATARRLLMESSGSLPLSEEGRAALPLNTPVFLFGHSFGGLISLRYLQTRQGVAGGIIAAPWLRLAFQPAPWKLAIGRVARMFWPTLTQYTGVNLGRLSRDAAFLDTQPHPELKHQRISARLFYEIERERSLARAAAPGLAAPTLFLHGQADPVTDWRATKAVYEAAGSADKTLRLYPESVHEMHNDLNREEVISEIVGWLERRAEAGS